MACLVWDLKRLHNNYDSNQAGAGVQGLLFLMRAKFRRYSTRRRGGAKKDKRVECSFARAFAWNCFRSNAYRSLTLAARFFCRCFSPSFRILVESLQSFVFERSYRVAVQG